MSEEQDKEQDKEKEIPIASVEVKKLPPFDQVPEAKPMPALKRKTPARLDTDPPNKEPVPVPPHLDLGEGDKEICGMHPSEVFSNLEFCNRGSVEFARQSTLLNKRIEEIKLALKRIHQTTFLLGKHQARLQSMNPKNPADGIKAFQGRTQERKMAAVQNSTNLLKGLNLNQLKKQLDPASQLDQSMRRQGGFGQKRPVVASLHKPQNA